jgi:hypothetical protein
MNNTEMIDLIKIEISKWEYYRVLNRIVYYLILIWKKKFENYWSNFLKF